MTPTLLIQLSGGMIEVPFPFVAAGLGLVITGALVYLALRPGAPDE